MTVTTPTSLRRLRDRVEDGNSDLADDTSCIFGYDEASTLLDVAEAALSVARTWAASGFFGRPHVPDAIALREALKRLDG